MAKNKLKGALRHVLTTAGGGLGAAAVLSTESAQNCIGAVGDLAGGIAGSEAQAALAAAVTLGGFIWSWIDKKDDAPAAS